MIGKPEWFRQRKWTGWGLNPATWQGWLYLALFVVAMFGTQYIPADQSVRMIALGIVGVILIIDTIDIMRRIKKDERDTLHEAIAERNALWVIIFILATGVAYQAARSALVQEKIFVDPVIIIALIAGLFAKTASHYYLDKKD